MLKIRGFVRGRDEDVWVSVWNEAFGEFEDFRSISVEDMLKSEENPAFDAAGMFLVELDGKPVGIVNAYVDKMREEKKGFIRVLGVVPEYRRRGVGRSLAQKAIESLKERGMQTVEASAVVGKPEAVNLWEGMGFYGVRVFSLMRRSLENIPSGIGENNEATLRTFRKGSMDDLKLLNWLSNEAFKEHYNYRPDSVEETQYFLEQEPTFKEQDWLFVLLKNTPVGYVGVGIDETYNKEKRTRAGWILSIGVLKPNRLRGVGTRLMIEGMRLLQARGMTEALLGVDDENPTRAIQLYLKTGFTVLRKDQSYQKTL